MNHVEEPIKCLICGEQTTYKSNQFQWHLKKRHKGMTTKEYYDIYMKQEGEGFCKHCHGPSKPERNIIKFGYKPYCSQKCWNASDEKVTKLKESCASRDYTQIKKKFNQTCQERYGANGYTQTEEWAHKKKQTMIERYGVEHNFQMQTCVKSRQKTLQENKEEINQKRSAFWTEENVEQVNVNRVKSLQEKYGVDNVFQIPFVVEKIKEKHEQSGKWLVGRIRTRYMKYRVRVDWITRNRYNTKKLIEENEYDYYTGEKMIKCHNKALEPTIDHKISVFYGFQNNIPPEEIAHIDNLCVCSRRTNSKKSRMTEQEFREILEL